MKYINPSSGAGRYDAVLVVPPFSVNTGPSLAMGLLKAALSKAGVSCRVDYADLRFNTAFGIQNVMKINSGEMTSFLGEYVFAEAAGITTEKGEPEIRVHFSRTLSPLDYMDLMGTIAKAKAFVPQFVEETAHRILACRPKIVGVSSCFQQRNAALAILKKIKSIDPDVVTVMGGANCFGQAGLAMLRHFDFIDLIFFGEADDIIGPVFKNLVEGYSKSLPDGVLSRKDALPETAPHHIVIDLDALPYPDYDDFFEIIGTDAGRSMQESLNLLSTKEKQMTLFLEGSRGCRWGEHHPCTFCGLNGQHRIYRAKDPKRFFEELCAVSARYGMTRVNLTDTLMPKSWPTALFPLLKTCPVKFQLFTEMRTTFPSNLMKEMQEAGIVFTQPGVESLSQHALDLMHKGVTVMNNLNYLKFSEKYGISPAWNIIYGLPGETIEDYRQQTALIPLLEHLKGPNCANNVVFARDSVYFNCAEKYGLDLVPKPMYAFHAPKDADYQRDIAIYFDNAAEKISPEMRAAAQQLHDAALAWQLRYLNLEGHIRLDYADLGDQLLVIDTRRCREIRTQLLLGAERDICLSCKTPVNLKGLMYLLKGKYTEKEVSLAINALMCKKLLIRYGSLFLTLAIEYTERELVNREIEDFLYFRKRNDKMAKAFDEAMDRVVKAGDIIKDDGISPALRDAITAFARRFGMYFTGEDLERYYHADFSHLKNSPACAL